MAHEYKVIPAPRKGKRGNGSKGPSGRFANAVEATLNDMAADGWEFVRAETLGADEREGLMRRKIETFHGVLVFKRDIDDKNTSPTTIVGHKDEPAFSKERDEPVLRAVPANEPVLSAEAETEKSVGSASSNDEVEPKKAAQRATKEKADKDQPSEGGAES